MHNTRSNTRENTVESHKAAVRVFLRTHGEVASKEALHVGTEVPAWYISHISSTDAFYTSLNHNGKYNTSNHIVGHRSTHDGFWRSEVNDDTTVFTGTELPKPLSNTSRSAVHLDLHPLKPSVLV